MAKDPRETGPTHRSPEEVDLDARRRALGSQIDALTRRTESETKARSAVDTSGFGRGFRYSADFVSGVVAGVLIGWLIDHFVGTKPWGLIIFIGLGFVAGVTNILRLVEREKQGRDPGQPGS